MVDSVLSPAAVGLPLPPALLSIVVSYCDSDGKCSCAFTWLLPAGLMHCYALAVVTLTGARVAGFHDGNGVCASLLAAMALNSAAAPACLVADVRVAVAQR